MEILGYVTLLLVGTATALVGGGGSILTLAILVYLFKVSAELSTSYALLVGGLSAAGAALGYGKQQLINYRMGIVFGIPSIIGVLIARKYILFSLPASGNFLFLNLTKDQMILIFFSILMLCAAISMLRTKEFYTQSLITKSPRNLVISLQGLVVGGITGIVGAGGGFVIVPMLFVLGKLPIKEAIGTSFFIITLKSLFGFLGDFGKINLNWSFLAIVCGFSLTGIAIGSRLNRILPSFLLKKIFGYLMFGVSIFIFLKQLIFS